jgi:drug/metabolite transporter (DMT)-like permease
MSKLIVLVYIVIGIFVALNRDYGVDVDGIRGILSLILAVLLWPLVLLGVDLHLGKERRGREGAAMLGLAWPYASAAVAARLDRRPSASEPSTRECPSRRLG